MFMFWISCAAAGLSLGLVCYVLLRPASLSPGAVPADRPALWLRLLWPWVLALTPVCRRLLSWRHRHVLQVAMVSAGVHQLLGRPEHFLALQCLCAGSVAATLAVGFLAGGVLLSAAIPAILPCTLIAFIWPRLQLRTLARRRQVQLRRQLPFLLDMTTLCVQAGMNLHGALQQAANFGPAGPLRDELRFLLGEVRAGKPRLTALDELAQRTGLDEMHSLVAALAQAEQTGMSLGPLLQSQSAQRRSERFLRAEKQALEAPVKMLFPMVLCIFPCTFMIIAFPVGSKLLAGLL